MQAHVPFPRLFLCLPATTAGPVALAGSGVVVQPAVPRARLWETGRVWGPVWQFRVGVGLHVRIHWAPRQWENT